VFLSLLLAPALMAAAALIGQRLGPAAAGWVVALPVSFAVSVVAVTLDAGTRTATAMALSAATHVPAQVVFAVVFAGVLRRGGLLLGVAGGAAAYVACGVALASVPDVIVLAAAVPALALAPRVMIEGRPRLVSQRRWPAIALTCWVAWLIVGAAVLTSRMAGPQVAGAVVAFPTMSTTLAVVLVTRDGPLAGAQALAGLVRSLPCYLAFCVVIVLGTPSLGLLAIALGFLASAAAGRATWRGVPVARRPAPAR
jgi:hypothetical protein